MPSTTTDATPALSTPILATREQLAKRYAVSVRTIDEWRAEEVIPHIRFSPKFVRFDIPACDAAVREWSFTYAASV